MPQKFYKYHGAGNDFLLADNRDRHLSLSSEKIRHLCDRHTGFGADGVMLLEDSADTAFRMVFYNPDGSGGMMCGNGGRCIVAFAADLGLVKPGEPITFDAPDGRHQAEILPVTERLSPSAELLSSVAEPVEATEGEPFSQSPQHNLWSERTVRLKMRDVSGIRTFPDERACFLDTGTRHLVKFVNGLKDYPVMLEGRTLRHDPRFAPAGVNVNFVEPVPEGDDVVLHIRTFEKGVEDETLACGTGIVASAIVAYSQGIAGRVDAHGRVTCLVKAAIATLAVDFVPRCEDETLQIRDIWLTGPSDFVGTVEIML
ncbi:MAG TPA: diaminopimelate epimerase [Rikenellaceae bacterium]|nr:diaminopimelate epimerase [Rikenellaceae bacterium]